MRAWLAKTRGAPAEVLELVGDAPVPEPGPGQVRIRVAVAALNWSDDLVCRGRYQVKPEPPFSPGLEGAGVVDAVGESSAAASFEPGDRVMANMALPWGSLAEYALAEGANTYRVVEGVGDEQAAGLLIQYQTTHIALHRRGQLRAGETLLVHAGAGGMGSAAIQLGKAAGARVIATAGGAEKVALCRELGADLAIDYRSEDFAEIVNTDTDGRGADVVFDSVGGDTFDRSRKCIAFEGRILIIGFSSGRIADLPTNHAMVKNYSVVGVYPARYAERDRPFLEETNAALQRMLADGEIDPLIRLDVPFEGAADAIVALADRKTVGKAIVRVRDGV